jgi:hypothetical protein
MGWFGSNKYKCSVCGKEINTKGRPITAEDLQKYTHDELLRQFPELPYSFIEKGGALSIAGRGPVPEGATVLACGECTMNHVDKVAALANQYGWGKN